MMTKSIKFLAFLAILSATALLTGCDERSISPLEESGGVYSVYGALSLDESTNYIRIRDLSIPFLSDSAKNLDAEVVFEDLQAGTSTMLDDTVVNFSGNYAHNFILDQELEPESTYRLTVNRSDGESVTSLATTPAITDVSMSVSDTPDPIDCSVSITFTYANVKDIEDIRMEIGFSYQGGVHWSEIGKVDQLRHRDNADEMYLTLNTQQLMVEVFPPPAIDNPGINPLFLLPTVRCNQLDSGTVRIRYLHFGPEWDSINQERGPLNPLESLDIEGGLGFLGAYRTDSYTYEINTE